MSIEVVLLLLFNLLILICFVFFVLAFVTFVKVWKTGKEVHIGAARRPAGLRRSRRLFVCLFLCLLLSLLLLAFTASHERHNQEETQRRVKVLCFCLPPPSAGSALTQVELWEKRRKTLADSAGCTHQASLPQGATDSRPSSDSSRDAFLNVGFSFALFIGSVGKEKKKKSWIFFFNKTNKK